MSVHQPPFCSHPFASTVTEKGVVGSVEKPEWTRIFYLQQIQERQQMNIEGMGAPVPNLLASLNLLEPKFQTEEGQKGMEVSLFNG